MILLPHEVSSPGMQCCIFKGTHTQGSADIQRPSEMLKGLQSPLCSSSHPVPSLGTSKMQRNSLSYAAASIIIILPNAVPQGDGDEM